MNPNAAAAAVKSATSPWWKEPTREQWCSFLAAWAGWVLDAFDFTIFLLVIPNIAAEFGVSTTAVVSSVTLTLLVRLVGGAVAGAAADRWGRRIVLMISVIWFAVCDASVAFAPSLGWVLALRMLFGFGMGAEWTAGTTLAMENWPERSRGIASGILQGSWTIGYLLAALVSSLVVPAYGWRALFLVAAIPALLVIPIRMFVKENEEWRTARATGVRSSFRDFLEPTLLKTMLWATVTMTLGFSVYYAFTSLYPTMLAVEHRLDAGAITFLIACFNVGMLVGAVLLGPLAAKRGVRFAIAIPSLLVLPVLPFYVGAVPALLPIGAFLTGALGVGWAGVVPMTLTGLFPVHVRARAVGLVYHAGAFFAAFVPTTIAVVAERGGVTFATSIALVAGGSLVVLLAALALGGGGMTAAPAVPEPDAMPAHA